MLEQGIYLNPNDQIPWVLHNMSSGINIVTLYLGFNNVFENMKPYFPTVEDHKGAMDALFRLQSTYKLKASTLAKG